MNIWCNVKLPPTAKSSIRACLDGNSVVFADETAERSALELNPVLVRAPLPDNAEVVFGQPTPQEALACAGLRWIHLNSAGYTALDRRDVRDALMNRAAILTTSSTVYAEPVAQHVLAMMLSVSRQLPNALHAQFTNRDWRFHELRSRSRLLNGQRVLILGFGSIAHRLVELLSPLQMNIVAVRRSPKREDPVPTYSEADADHWLSWADHVVNILPATPDTRNYLNRERLERLRPGAVLYNVGRGVTVDQTALMELLQANRISAAYLDVTDPEPLPKEHPLWTIPNCYITPHSAGGHNTEPERLVAHFLNNFELYRNGGPLLNRVI